jgi:hypothetical protein
MEGLGLQPEVPHCRQTALRQTLNRILMAIDAFQFHRVRTLAHQSLRAIERRGLTLAKGEERHVGHHEFTGGAPYHCLGSDSDGEWLPRRCPGCGVVAVVGHGRRVRASHDVLHDSIRVRRGFCNHRNHTLTVLTAGCVPRAPYSLAAREQAMDRLASGSTLGQAAPDCRDPDRIADPSTIRRWGLAAHRSFPFLVAVARHILGAPTILAWDFRAAACILVVEPSSPSKRVSSSGVSGRGST